MPYTECMSWAIRRRILYLIGVFLFFAIVIGGPIAYMLLTVPPTCTDGIQNQGETAVDRGGPCPLLDPQQLQPSAVLWSRAFSVRDGSYNATSYIENPNDGAGVSSVNYIFKLYDSDNVLVAERSGSTFIMPGRITPVFEGTIDTGNRTVARSFFALTSEPAWQQMRDPGKAIAVSDISASDITKTPRVTANVRNIDVSPLFDISFVATIFDRTGNAYASSATHLDRLAAGETQQIVFTWPDPFTNVIGRIDVIPRIAPVSTATAR